MYRPLGLIIFLLTSLSAQSAMSVQIESSINSSVTKGPKKPVALSDAKSARVNVSMKIHGRSEEATLDDLMTISSMRVKVPYRLNASSLDICEKQYVVSGCDETSLIAKTVSLQVTAPGVLTGPVTGTIYIYYGGPGKLVTLLEVDRWRVPSLGSYQTTRSSTEATVDLTALLNYVRNTLTDKNGVLTLKPGLTLHIDTMAEFGLNDSLSVTSCPKKWTFSAGLLRESGSIVQPTYRKTISCTQTTSG